MRRLSTSFLALALGASVVSGAASAADLPAGGYKDDAAPASDWNVEGIEVGGIIAVMPTYEGSSKYEVLGFPYILPQFSGGGTGFFSRIDARALDDVRFKLIERDGFFAGPLAGYAFGRQESDGDLLEGLGKVDDLFVAGGFVGYGWDFLEFDVAYQHYFGDVDGYQIQFGVEAKRPISEHATLTGRVGATYADENYMQTFFGISDAQALSSPIFATAYDADAGFKDVYAEIGIKADLDERWSARASVQYSRLIGDAGDSPVVEDENQFVGVFGLSYKFGVGGY